MTFYFDFGDNWEFSVLLEAINPSDKKHQKPVIKESFGKAPQQYVHWEDEDWEQEDEEW